MKKWGHLAGYGLLIFSSQILWVTYSPITTDVAVLTGTSVGKIGTLAALFPIVYIVVAFPAGRWLDTHFKLALGFGAFTIGIGALARFILPYNYTWLLIFQFLMAVGQPFIVNAITAYASRYFPKANRSLAISIASVSLFLGVIFAMVLSPLLFGIGGLMLVYIVFAIPSVISAIWVVFTVVTRHINVDAVPIATTQKVSLMILFQDKFLWILSGLLAIGLGIFDVLSTWIEPLFAQYNIPGSVSGPLLAVMLISGIISSTFLPSLVDKKDARRTYMSVTLIITGFMFLAIPLWQNIFWIIFWLVISGFFLLAGLLVIMDWTEKHFDSSQHGTAVGFVMLSSHVGGVVMIYIIQILMTPAYIAFITLAVITFSGLFLTRLLPKREIS